MTRWVFAVCLSLACGHDDWEDIRGLESTLLGTPGSDPNPLTFWWYATAPEHQWGLRADLECALERWRQATCLPLDVSFDAHHWARIMKLEGLSGQVVGTWDSARIRIDSDLAQPAWCQMLTHEIGHVLRRSNGHSAIDGSMSYGITHVFTEPISHIVQDDIDRVCAIQDCGCAPPE